MVVQEIRERIISCLKSGHLPDQPSELFGELYSDTLGAFPFQESLHWDYKKSFPKNTKDDFFAGVVRLVCAFYNTYGGIIIFGVDDVDRTPGHSDVQVDIENFNHILRQKLNVPVETLHRSYLLPRTGGVDSKVDVLLVPKRPAGIPPVRFQVGIGRFAAGVIWGRFGHEVLEVGAKGLALLYMSRDDFGLEATKSHQNYSIHRSLPPSPATSRKFIGRANLMDELWIWLVDVDAPRHFLFGAGGSGKSTLAYEFARGVAESGRFIRTSNGIPLDFVLYLSAKETGIQPFDGKVYDFSGKDFSSADELIRKILVHSGYENEDIALALPEDEAWARAKVLFSDFQGLIVIDDIDALIRRGVEPGMERLFRVVARSDKGAKILYTLRNAPSMVKGEASRVPGLDFETEYLPFVEAFCGQIGIKAPPEGFTVDKLASASERIPLVLETILCLKRTCSTFDQALDLYEAHKGEHVREYMFNREYERLPDERARLLLAAMVEYDEPLGFEQLRTALHCNEEQLSDAIGEVREIFLREPAQTDADTTYELLPMAKQFVASRSAFLARWPQLQARIHWLRSQAIPDLPQLTSLRIEASRQLERGDVAEALRVLRRTVLPPIVTEHPRYQALMGSVLAAQEPPQYSDARDAFRSAWTSGWRDLAMLRDWFYMESDSGFSFDKAIAVCDLVLTSVTYKGVPKSEFLSKKGQVYRKWGKSCGVYDINRAVVCYRSAVECYLDALPDAHDPLRTAQWLQSTFNEYLALIVRTRLDRELFEFLRTQALAKRPIDAVAEQVIIYYRTMTRSSHCNEQPHFAAQLDRVAGLRSGRASLHFRTSENREKFGLAISELQDECRVRAISA